MVGHCQVQSVQRWLQVLQGKCAAIISLQSFVADPTRAVFMPETSSRGKRRIRRPSRLIDEYLAES